MLSRFCPFHQPFMSIQQCRQLSLMSIRPLFSQHAVISTPHFRIFACEIMYLLLIKICAIAAVNLVAGGTEGRNVTMKSGRSLQLKRDAEHLRTYQSTLNGEEERGFDFAAFRETLNNFHRGVLANFGSLDDMLKSVLETKIFNEFFEESYTRRMSPDDVYWALKDYGKHVQTAAQHRYADFVEHKNLHSTLHPTLAESVHPTTPAESVQPTVADPLSTRSKGKGLAEVVGGQLASEVWNDPDKYSKWLQNQIPPIEVLKKILKRDEVGDRFLEDLRISKWTSYVTKYNDMYGQSTTVFGALKERGVKEETMVSMVFSWGVRQESVENKVNMMSLSVDEKQQLINHLHFYQEIARTDILNGLREVWFSRNLPPYEVLEIIGLLPDLETRFDRFRFDEWLKYLEMWCTENRPTVENPYYTIGFYLSFKGYTSEQLKRFLPFLDENSPPSEKLKDWIELQSWIETTQ